MTLMVADGRRRNRRPQTPELGCPAHPEPRIEGKGQKSVLHRLTPEQLKARGMGDKKAKLVIQVYPLLILRSRWPTSTPWWPTPA